MALKLIRHSCALSIIFVALLTLHAFATHSAARPLDDKTTNHDDEVTGEMTSAEMQKRYVRPDGAVEAEIEGVDRFDGDHGEGIRWNRGEWNEGGGWNEGGNWDKGGGWNNRPPWAAPVASGKK